MIPKEIEKRAFKILKMCKKKPLQYCFNKAYFLNDDYYVDKNVLIPRSETEYLVTRCNELIKKYLCNDVKILEIGTGSGVISISLKKMCDKYDITSTDISKKALNIAQKNAYEKNKCIKFIKKDILNGVEGKFDCIISNPPYIPKDSKNVSRMVYKNEPKKALYAKDNGLYFYKEIIGSAKKFLNKKSIIAFEILEESHDLLEKYARKYFPSALIIKENDLNNWNRYFFIINIE